jgi:membrane protease YdiL (CAAX protease family)
MSRDKNRSGNSSNAIAGSMSEIANDRRGSGRPSNVVLFAWLMAASVIATIAMCPALLSLVDPTRPTPFADESVDGVRFVIGFIVANTVLSAVAIAVGLRLEPTVGMGVPLLRRWLAGDDPNSFPASQALVRCLALALGLAATVLGCGVAFRNQLPALPDNFVFPPIWQGILMMLGAAVREEILCRFFALNFFTWVGMKAFRQQRATPFTIWGVNVLVALLFACMHLIPVAPVLDLNSMATGGAVSIATLAGALLGWVYWRHGLLAAMFTHAVSGVLVYLGGRGLMNF